MGSHTLYDHPRSEFHCFTSKKQKMKKTLLLNSTFAAAFFLFSMQASSAANRETNLADAEVAGINTDTHLPNLIRLHPGKEIQSAHFNDWAVRALNTSAGFSFQQYQTETDALGMTHTRYKEYYQGIPVDGAVLIAHSKNGLISTINGEFIQEATAATQAALNEKQALQKALNKIHAAKYKWENPAAEQALRGSSGNPTGSYYPKGEFVLVHEKGQPYSAASWHLAYKFNIYAEEPLYRSNVFVDANSGKILDEQNLICTVDASGTAQTKYSGTQTITSDFYGTNQYRLRETGRGLGVETYNLNNSLTYSNKDFLNLSATWSSTGNDQAATDAHFGAERTYDFYKQTFNRNSIDNKGYKLISYVHYNTNYANAYWDGQEMTYGDGSAAQGFTIMTALDVCGHEITHGLTSNTAALGNGEAGALNEGFSDIFGTTIEHFARPTQWDWLIGEDITTNGKGLRNMSNPKQLNQPDTYLGTNWDPNGEVHNNDGPCIYWYYLLCQGKSGTNDIGSAYNVTGIGMSDASKIAFRALTVYFTSGTNYAAARSLSIQASTDLFGSCSAQTIACTNAWFAVGVGPQYSPIAVAPAFTSNQTTSCSLPLNIQFSNGSANSTTYMWDFGDGSTSTSINPTHTYSSAGSFDVKLVAQGCGTTKDSVTHTAYITINSPTAPTTTGNSRCGSGQVVLNASGTGTINWYANTKADTILGTGTTFNTPVVASTTTFYAATSVAQTPVTGGPADSTIGTGGYLNSQHAIVFTANDGLTIQSVDVYANGAGARTIELQDAGGNTLKSVTVNLTATPGKQTIALNFHVPAGIGYQLASTGTITNLFRNNAGAVFPYSVGGILSITGTDLGAAKPAYYYYFYNWVIQKDPCISATVPTVATVTPSAGTMSVNSTAICAGAPSTLTVTGGSAYSWSTGANTASIVVTPTTTTTYTVNGTVSGCTGSVAAIGTVTVHKAPPVIIVPAALQVCAGSTALATASGAATYSWSNGSSATTTTIPAVAGNIQLMGTDSNGCSATVTASITVNANPIVTFALANDTVCVNNPGIALTGNPAGGTFFGKGVTGSNFNPTAAGLGLDTLTYNYVSIATGCGNTKAIVVKVDACTGIAAYSLPSVVVYPNPANDYILLKNYTNTIQVKMYDANGKLVLEAQQKGAEEFKVNIAHLAPGLYQLSILNNGQPTQERVLIER
jgi:Zn-dependent metalloprotease